MIVLSNMIFSRSSAECNLFVITVMDTEEMLLQNYRSSALCSTKMETTYVTQGET
jgi:hypothetical protein